MTQETELHLPKSEEFRPWLQDAIAALDTTAAALCRAGGLNRNTLYAFLQGTNKSIGLDTAATVVIHLRALAAEQGRALPPIKAVS